MTTTRGTMADRPVARVLPLLGLPQLDRLFDYSVPESMSAEALPGTRVRIRFSGKLVNGIVLERAESAEHDGALTPLKDVVSPEIVPAAAGPARRFARGALRGRALGHHPLGGSLAPCARGEGAGRGPGTVLGGVGAA